VSDGFVIEAPPFHITQVVDNRDRAVDCFTRLFQRPIRDGGFVAGRGGAIFTRVGEFLLEAMIPDDSATALKTFVKRYGDHWHSIAWYVRGIDAIAAHLRSAGVGFIDIHGAPIEADVPRRMAPIEGDEEWWSAMFVTRMADTFGLHEICEPKSKHELSRWMGSEPLANDPLTIIGGSHLTSVVPDLGPAVDFWRSLGGAVVAEVDDALLGSHSVFIRVGEAPGVMHELAEPRVDGPTRRDLDATGRAIFHAATFRVRDLDAVRRHLAAQGFGIESEHEQAVVTDPQTTSGIRYGFAVESPWAPA
jgi:catechol 2,3-dioxygenase-like lactoylglutathione lyase family enzyme